MTIAEIDTNVQNLVENFDKASFIYDFMRAFDFNKSTIKRLQLGTDKLSKNPGEIIQKKKFLFKELHEGELEAVMKTIGAQKKIKHDPRFIILTDYKNILAFDTKTEETLETTIKDLGKEYAFFLPLAGMEKIQYQNENPADVKAAVKMAKLYDEIKQQNPTQTPQEVKNLNVFLSRLLFCFFAEDTEIFEDNQFTNSIASHTQEDASDLQAYLTQLFEVLNVPFQLRSKKLPTHLAAFPYVNGGLFEEEIEIPVISKKGRKIIIESGEQNWKHINPDIFGSMIQAVVTPDHRGGLGMHYTSVPNIMKVIEPLFLNDLYEDFEKAKGNQKKLQSLLVRLSNLKIFDPACGSGNFLIIAYKELRKLEILIFKEIATIKGTLGSGQLGFGNEFKSIITLSQFYGIELDDFAHEVAGLSLWLAEHQMNTVFLKEFGTTKPALPLKDGGHIVHGNACRLDWEVVCPKEEGKEVYILGNPPYLGAKELDTKQKEDVHLTFTGLKNVKRLDYIGCWFKLATDYINSFRAKYAFVSTNSICQGEQVSLIFPYIFFKKQELFFCHQSFTWSNNAKSKAGVTCVIVGISNQEFSVKKFIYGNDRRKSVKNISPYLIEGASIYMEQRSTSISGLPKMILGSSGFDGGNLMLSEKESSDFIQSDIKAKKFIRRFMSGDDFLNGKKRFCLWINDSDVKEAESIELIKNRIIKCREYRINGGRDARKAASVPHRFFYRTYKKEQAILFPKTTSGRRIYVPVGYVDDKTIISNASFLIYDTQPFVFALLSSKLHCIWMSITSARHRTDYRYSVNLTYNTFPFPKISDTQKTELETHVYALLEQRELNSGKTLAQLYDPDKMPEGLRKAHHELDLAVERCYRKEPFKNDEERLAYLFKLYEKMIKEEQTKNTLFAKAKKTRKKKQKK